MRRPVLPGLAFALLAIFPLRAWGQQGSVQASGAVQAITGDTQRIAGQTRFEPDFGIVWLQPGARFGIFQLEARGARRHDQLHPGRLFVSLRELKYRGVSWAIEAGDTHFTPAIGDYKFSNLFTPAITFNGASITGRTQRTTVAAVAGRTSAWRNIFGTDPETLNQTIGSIRVAHRWNDRVEMSARGSRVRTSDLREFGFSIAGSDQAGGGMRVWVTPSLQAAFDASIVSYRREGSPARERDASAVAGVSWLHGRGWLQVNASRFSPGDFPALNTPLPDREGVFAAGEYNLLSRLRIFGGGESFRSNLEPEAALLSAHAPPQASGTREFGGVRLRLAGSSMLTLRGEHGGRVARPLRTGIGSDSDTGSWTAEWQVAAGPFTSFTRYSHRDNVDRKTGAGTYTQHDASLQLFATVSRRSQLFATAIATRNELAGSGGSTYWQLGGGGQVQTPRRDLYLRSEITISRNVDMVSQSFVPRESMVLGLNGQLTRNVSVAFNVQVDRAPMTFETGSPWLTRSTLRVSRIMPTGSAYMSSAAATSEGVAGRGSGSVTGTVYADWNGNGTFDPSDQLLEGIPVRVGDGQLSTTGRDGQFAFLNVPTGTREVGLDTGSLPIDFDPPEIARIEVQIARGVPRRVSFPLIPLGSITGRVLSDANNNGRADATDEPLSGGIVILDGGARSEQVRSGRFRFDAVRGGTRTVTLLLESLPEGAVIRGDAEVKAALTRGSMTADLAFLVSVEKRPEIRRVFPPKGGTRAASRPGERNSAERSARPAAGTKGAPPAASNTNVRPDPAALPAPVSRRFAVQVAAFHDPDTTAALMKELKSAGLKAYVSHPGPADPAPYRIRVGPFTTRAAADKAMAEIEKRRGQKVWVVRER